MRIGLISDSHGLLDEAIFGYFGACHEVWHAGDFGGAGVLDRLQAFKPLRAVWGNVDGAEVRAALPRELVWECEGIRVYMTHIGGYPGRYEPRVRRELTERQPGLFCCGHSHIARVMRDPALGLMHMNPGACGHQGLHSRRTALRFQIEAGRIGGVELIELGPRGQKASGGR